MTNKIKLEAPRSVNKCHMVHTDMAGGDSAGVCNFSLDSAVRGINPYGIQLLEAF